MADNMAKFTLSYTFVDGSFLEEQDNGEYKYWEAYGLPNYEGTLNGFAKMYPKHIQQLIDEKVVRNTNDLH